MTPSLGFALLGAGRSSTNHAQHLCGEIANAHLVAVINALPEGSPAPPRFTANRSGPQRLPGRRAIFCEKPVALDLAETRATLAAVAEAGFPFQIGFYHRYELDRAEMFRSQSFDPELPTEVYVAVPGGIHLDPAIHDTDTARFVMGEVEQVSAPGRALIAPFLERYSDIDTSILTLRVRLGRHRSDPE